MRRRNITSLLALLALVACAAAPALAAAAVSGGAAAPSPASGSAVHPKIRPVSLATWFGPGFYGQQTACGQTLTPAVVGVANRTLPCGTLVAVSYHGRHIVVPVLDRGPYSQIGADWDLTAGAARALGVSDTIRIHAKIVGRAANTPTLGLPAEAAQAASVGVTGGASAG
jgi:rare lipoprotein A (peptidoglycan hydrolase)